MDKVNLEAKSRKDTGKKAAKLLRAAGRIPAVVYNSEGKSTMVDVDSTEFNKVWRTITATTMLTLNVDGAAHNVFIKDVEYNIREDKVLHADFWEPAADKGIVLKMKLLYSGTPAGVLKGGFLLKHVPEVTIKAKPGDVPERIVLDISKINIGEKLCVKDMNLGNGVTILTPAETSLVSISAGR
ncbi:MAG: 50S ribosomal protein L25 [Treponema sp.]|nr:50S ribosomal protein L25 [Treponema sp.]